MKVCPKCDHANPDKMSFCEKCGLMLPEGDGNEPDPILGTLLVNKFRIKELIGQGAMGRVYSATQEPINRQVAVKILHEHLIEDRRVARRFQREAEAASRFSHPNSIGIFDFGQTDDGSLYIAMEYIDGLDLGELIAKEAPLSFERSVRIATQVLNALHLAHESKIIHRDLKPENIMLTDLPGHKDFVKVCDFGIAKIQQMPGKEQESALTMFGMICGTPYYMSPEQAKGEELDGRTDLYSMGVILYEMLTGEVPFKGSTPVEVIARHLTDPPLPPSKLRPELRIPAALENVILRAMSKGREERFADASEFASSLKEALKEAEFQTDLERVLQEAQEEPKRSAHTPSAQLNASNSVPQVAAGAVLTAPQAKMSGPPVAAPRTTLPPTASPTQRSISPRASGVNEIVASHHSIREQQNPSRNTPLPSPVPPIAKQTPPLILTDEVDELDTGSKKSGVVFILFAGIVIMLGAGYFMFFHQANTTKQTTPQTLRGYAPKLVKQRRTLSQKGRKRPSSRHKIPKNRATKTHAKKLHKRRIALKIAKKKALKKKFKKRYKRLARWKKYNQIYVVDFNSRGRHLNNQCLSSARRGHYSAANRNLNHLFRMLNHLRSIPSWAANNKFNRLKKKWDKVSSRANPSDKAKIEALLFPMMNAQGKKQYKKLNRMMNKVFSILRKY